MKFSQAFIDVFTQWLIINHEGRRNLNETQQKKMRAYFTVDGSPMSVKNPFRYHPKPAAGPGTHRGLMLHEGGHEKVCLVEGQHHDRLMDAAVDLHLKTPVERRHRITQKNLRKYLNTKFAGVNLSTWTKENYVAVRNRSSGAS